jgi:hypothetical protein
MTHNAAPVVVTDVQKRFSSMVVFMVKWAMASIPALIILFAIGVGLFFGFGILAATFDRVWGPVRGGANSQVSLQSINHF